MSGFSAEWLALREPFDSTARSDALVAALRARLMPGTQSVPLKVVDLGAGAGSNLRYLAPLLSGVQHWRLVDHDAGLLRTALTATEAWARELGARVQSDTAVLSIDTDALRLRVECKQLDLVQLDRLELPGGALVTAAALLDLVSLPWLASLTRRCRAAGAAACFALTYDGRATAAPAEPEDAEVLALFNQHQRGNKGFGPALGPGAPATAAASFEAYGYTVTTATSDWRIDHQATAMQRALLDGWLDAAAEIAPARRIMLEAWHARRSAHVLAGRSSLDVGHVDLVAWL